MRVGQQHLGIGEPGCAADFDQLSAALRGFQRCNQVIQHVADGDRLGHGKEPFWTDKNRLAFGGVAHHLEQGTTRPNHHAGPELGHRDSTQAQDMSGFMARAQVRGEVVGGVDQFTKINDTLDAGQFGRRGKITGCA